MATVAFAPTLTCRISLAEIDAAVSARLGPTRIPGKRNLRASIGRSQCISRGTLADGARPSSAGSITAEITRQSATAFRGLKLRETDPDVDGLITDLATATVSRCRSRAGAPCRGQSASLNRPNEIGIDELADLVAERVCAYLEVRIGQLDRLPEPRERTTDDKDLQIGA